MAALGSSSPASVRDLLPLFPRLGYTTLMTTLDRLYKKGLLLRERRGRFNAYWPAISRQDLRTAIASHILASGDDR